MKIKKKEFLYLSNLLSISRLFFMIPIYYLIRQNTPSANFWVIIVAIVGASTDFLDGYISRKRHQVTDLGKVLDPLADKICLGLGLIILIVYRGFPVPLAVFLIYRDLMIIIMGGLIFRKLGHPTPANFWGKLNTTVIAFTGILFLIRIPDSLLNGFIVLSYFTIFASGVVYAKLGQDILCHSWKSKFIYRAVLIVLTGLVVLWTLNFNFILVK